MREKEKIRNAATGGRRIYNPVQRDAATFLQTSEETGGERTLAEVEVAPGGGTRPHYHKTYAEHFEVIEGVLEVLVGEETRVLRAGQKAVVPKNTLHRFHNGTDETVTFLCEMRPGQPGFEKTLKVGYGLARDGLTRSDGTPKKPLPHGPASRMVRDPGPRLLHRHRAADAAAGEASPTQGDRP